MHELLKEFISKKEQEKRDSLDKEKNEFLLSSGLCEKEYSEKDTWDEEYRHIEWDEKEQKRKYYKNIPIEITDSEYQQLKELCEIKNEKKEIYETNNIATALTVIAWIVMICGFIAGIALGNVEVNRLYSSYKEFSFAVALTYWAIALISGVLMLGLAEVIKLLNEIKNK